MAESLIPQILTIAGTLLGAIVGIAGNHWASRNRHRRDKTWERQVETYSRIISSLTRAITVGGSVIEAYDEDPHRAHASDWVNNAIKDFWTAYSGAFSTFNDNRLLASPIFIARMDEMRRAVHQAADNDFQPDAINEAIACVKAALPGIIKQAEREIRP